ncbi:hypothetical protein ACTMTF_08100 [Nonomuraea sp. ZG12]
MTCQDGRVRHLEAIEHAGRRVRALGAPAHPTAPWSARILVMGPEAGCAI